jgi:two-component system phosphate regulon sensor histidine kinase PhoR
MKKRNLWLITALMTFALLGVFVMQLYYIKESYKLKSQLFEQNVDQVLESVVNKIQKKNAVLHINKRDTELKTKRERNIRSQTDTIVAFKVRFRETEERRKDEQRKLIWKYLIYQDSVIKANYISPIIITEEAFQSYSNIKSKESALELTVKDVRDLDGNLIKRNVIPDFSKVKRPLNSNSLPDTLRYIALDPATGRPNVISLPSKDPDLITKFRVEDAKAERRYQMDLNKLYTDTIGLYSEDNYNLIKDVAQEIENKNIPLENRIPSQQIIDTLLRRELLSKSIDLSYSFWLTPAKNSKKIIYQNIVNGATSALPKNTFQKAIFSKDIVISDPGMLYISFPEKNAVIFSTMFATLASSAGLLLILVFIFAYTIYAIIRQKKLSEMKTDFINNMTHEFKTPVATIMIASEALKDPEVTEDPKRISRLAGIIYDENVRLGNHIERVLSVARLDKNELTLDVNNINVNDLIYAVVDSMDLQLQKKNTHISLHLDATEAEVRADELHLSNVIYNLIDNAIKYSIGKPIITISTKNIGKKLVISIADEGIGMTNDQTKRIFDQFYRVPTGNLHDVKGFGLGLNYVNAIIAQMSGNIKVFSEKDKGTTFEVMMPLNKK